MTTTTSKPRTPISKALAKTRTMCRSMKTLEDTFLDAITYSGWLARVAEQVATFPPTAPRSDLQTRLAQLFHWRTLEGTRNLIESEDVRISALDSLYDIRRRMNAIHDLCRLPDPAQNRLFSTVGATLKTAENWASRSASSTIAHDRVESGYSAAAFRLVQRRIRRA